MRTLVIHLGGIGDFLLSCPVLPALRRDGPVELLGRRDRLQLAVDGGLAEAAHDANALELDTIFSTPSDTLRRFLGRFDRCIAWLRPDGAMISTIKGCGVRSVQAFPGLPPADWTRNASSYYTHCLGLAEVEPLTFQFQNPPADRLDIVIHPGSGGRKKNWPLDNFIQIAHALESEQRKVVWCSGPAEEDIAEIARLPLLPPMPLTALARRLSRARLYVGNDSGITHLAATAGCPTVAVFGPTNPRVWAPFGRRARVVQGQDAQFPNVDDVLQATLKTLSAQHD